MKQERSRFLCNRFNTTVWTVAFTSFFVFASITVTLTKHPPLPITVVSSGKWVDSQVSTSIAPKSEMSRVKTNLKLLALVHPLPEVAARLTLRVMLAGRTGRATGARRARVNLATREAYRRAATLEVELGSESRVV